MSRSRRSVAALTLAIALAIGVGSTLALSWSLGGALSASAAPAGELHVCHSGCAYASVQAAVDAANPDDVIKVAQGRYVDVNVRDGITQVVYISKTVTIQGGFTTTDWITPDPTDQVTTLDAQGQGRVMVVSDTTGVTLRGLAITGGDATGLGGGPSGYDGGGGVFATGAPSLTVVGCEVYSNSAHRPWSCCGYGGGLYVGYSDHVVLEGNTINHNWGNEGGYGKGGGLYLTDAHYIIVGENAIHDNVATSVNGRGGGMFARDCNHGLFDRNTVRGNLASTGADARGGGICLESSDYAHLRDNLIEDNVATGGGWGYGAGIYVDQGYGVVLEGNVIVGNETSSNPASTGFAGGGLYLEWTYATVVNTVVADNYAGALGSGIYVDDCSPRFLHTTVARNRGGDGSGICVTNYYKASSDVAFTNTIIFSHTLGISVTAGNTATLNGTLWYNNGTNLGGAGAIQIGAVSVYGDPAFDLDGYHLTAGSAAKDAGVDSGVTTDIDGDSRPGCPGYDIGADELPRQCIFLPLVVKGWQAGDLLYR